MNLNRRKCLFLLKYEAPCKSVVFSLFIFGHVACFISFNLYVHILVEKGNCIAKELKIFL
jgi:hypothetical protein